MKCIYSIYCIHCRIRQNSKKEEIATRKVIFGSNSNWRNFCDIFDNCYGMSLLIIAKMFIHSVKSFLCLFYSAPDLKLLFEYNINTHSPPKVFTENIFKTVFFQFSESKLNVSLQRWITPVARTMMCTYLHVLLAAINDKIIQTIYDEPRLFFSKKVFLFNVTLNMNPWLFLHKTMIN